jgi:hypothetical protein
MYLRCKKCKEEKPIEISIEEYSRLEVSFSESHLKINCLRHNKTLLTINIKENQNIIEKICNFKEWIADASVLH